MLSDNFILKPRPFGRFGRILLESLDVEADLGYNMNKKAALALLIEAEATNMSSFKPLSEQTLMNNYVFSMVMREPGRIRPLLEYILDKKIRRISMVEPELREEILYLDHEEITGPYSRELDNAVNELKSNEERRQEYMILMTYGAEREAAGKYISLVEQIRRWYEKKLSIPIEDAASYAGITPSQFEGVLSLIKAHPDWDDAKVADKASWR